MGVNKTILVGRLGSDPELRYTPAGTAVVTVNIATNEVWYDKEKVKQERVEWHRLVFWRRNAEVVAEYAPKGREIYVEGRLQTRSWEDKDGVKRWTTEVIVRDLQLLGSGNGDSNRADKQTGDPGVADSPAEEPMNIPDDDIPF